jgi:hypothetical protein
VNIAKPTPHQTAWLRISIASVAGIAAFTLILSTILLLALHFVPARLTNLLEFGVEQAIDREIEVGELVNVKLGLNPEFTLSSVSISNPDWAPDSNLLTIEQLFFRLNLPSVWLKGPIFIDEVRATDVKAGLLAPMNRPPNWKSQIPVSTSAVTMEDSSLTPVIIRKAVLSRGSLTYIDPDQDISVSINELNLKEPTEGESLILNLDGAVNEIPLQIMGSLGPLPALVTQKNLQLDLSVNWGELALHAKGSIKDLINLTGPDLDLELSSPHSAPLLELLGIVADDGPVHFDATITDLKPGIAVNALGRINKAQILLKANLLDPLNLDGIDASATLNGPSLKKLGSLLEIKGLPNIPYTLSIDALRQGSLLEIRQGHLSVGQGQLTIAGHLPNFPKINNWQVSLQGKHLNMGLVGLLLGRPDVPNVPYDITGELKSNQDGVELLQVNVASPHSTLNLSGQFTDNPDYLNSEIKALLSADDLNLISSAFGISQLPAVPFSTGGKVTYTKTGWQLSDAHFSADEIQIELNGSVDRLTSPINLQAEFRLETKNLAATLTNYELYTGTLPEFPIAIEGTITGQPDKLNLKDLNVISGNSRITLSGFLGDPMNPQPVDLNIGVNTADLLAFLPDLKTSLPTSLPVNTSGSMSVSGNSVSVHSLNGQFGDIQLSLSGQFNTVSPHSGSHISLDAKTANLSKALITWIETDIPLHDAQLQLEASYLHPGIKIEKLDANIMDAQFRGRLSAEDIENFTTAEGEIRLTGSSSQNLTQLLGLASTVPDEPYALHIGIQNQSDLLSIKPIDITLAGSDLQGQLTVRPGEVPTIKASLHSRLLQLPFLLPDNNQPSETTVVEAPFSDKNPDQLEPKDLLKRVIPNQPVNFSWLNQLQGTIQYQVDEIFFSESQKLAATADLSIKNGELVSNQINFDGTSLIGNVDLNIKAMKDTNKFTAFVDMQRIPLILMMGGQPSYTQDSFYRARLQTEGNSIRELAQNTNGVLAYKSSGGRLNNRGLGLILGDMVSEILSLLNPYATTDKQTMVLCSAGAISIVNGAMRLAPGLVIRTDKMDITSGGALNLHNEKIDLAFKTQSRKGIGISASKAITPYLKIGGSLASPFPVLDVKGAAVSGSAAVATAGMSILAESLWDRWIGTTKNPCDNLLGKVSKKDKKLFHELLSDQ